ncbi:response regulator [Marinomonas transparens]|uniref:Response regulator transcription factor n=1 Tax=Marinomonas transparens TaxID=2795388 RepID=A0A934MYH1_9GAMM|nr:response regulator transcription factor [Marinomonas transparens]MBJ7536455.1 response regulator transcription factor [Marinomonas transparens]
MKILILDDHPLFREALSYILLKLEEKVCILEASDYGMALQHIAENSDIDFISLDLCLPGKDGFAALDTIKQNYPAMPIVVISSSDHYNDIKRALDSGARGYIPKYTESVVMLNALRLILSGGIYTPPNLINDKTPLTPRQVEVLKLLIEGLSNKVIASRMELAEGTVKMHITSIFKSLGVSNRTQAAMVAKSQGYA